MMKIDKVFQHIAIQTNIREKKKLKLSLYIYKQYKMNGEVPPYCKYHP